MSEFDLVVKVNGKGYIKMIPFADDIGTILVLCTEPITVLDTSPWPGHLEQIGNNFLWEGERHPGPQDFWDTAKFVLHTEGRLIGVIAAKASGNASVRII